MNFTREKLNDVLVEKVNLKRATYRETDEFKKLLFADIDNGVHKIVVDLNDCIFMDSTFLGSLINGLKRIKEKGGSIKIAAPQADAQALLDITGAVRVFDLYKTRDEAVESFNT